jgi:hypothetical protein
MEQASGYGPMFTLGTIACGVSEQIANKTRKCYVVLHSKRRSTNTLDGNHDAHSKRCSSVHAATRKCKDFGGLP